MVASSVIGVSAGLIRLFFDDSLSPVDDVTRSEVDSAASDAEIGRALRTFLAASVANGRLGTPFDVDGASGAQIADLFGEVLAGREKAEGKLRETRERLELAMHNTDGGLWD